MAGRFSVGKLVAVVAAGAAVAALCFALAVTFGEQPVSWRALLGAPDTDDYRDAATIFFDVRLPRVALAGIVGAALASSGAMLQALLRNPLADPFVLGVSGGAGLGATLALALGITSVGVASVSATSAFALAGALGATLLVLAVGRLAGGDRPHTTLLAGVIFNAFALAAILFVKALVAPDKMGSILFWLAGELGQQTPATLASTGAVVGLAVVVLCAYSPRLNLLTLGDDDARSLGVDVARSRLVLLLAASVAVAAAVALSGLIGFVGLLVPHLVRLVFGADQRLTLPASALLGGAFLMLADLAARMLFRVFNTEPPVGVITALLGGPVFLLLMVRGSRARAA